MTEDELKKAEEEFKKQQEEFKKQQEEFKKEKDIKETATIKAMREGFDKKVQELEVKHKQELEDQEKRLDQKHAEQIRTLFLGGSPSDNIVKQNNDDNDKTFEERVVEKMKEKLKLN